MQSVKTGISYIVAQSLGGILGAYAAFNLLPGEQQAAEPASSLLKFCTKTCSFHAYEVVDSVHLQPKLVPAFSGSSEYHSENSKSSTCYLSSA